MSLQKRLVLFDIDGTILHGGSLWKEAFIGAMNHFFPEFNFPSISFNGKTDIQICREMMADVGFSEEKINEKMNVIIDEYIERAQRLIPERAHEIKILPGVRELIEKLHADERIFLGLLTGNVKKGAHLKLSTVELSEYFKFGVYGDDHWNRYLLPAMAIERVAEHHGLHFTGKNIVIIGDTVHDVNCGKSIGVRSIAVGTGRNVAQDELIAQNPDYYFKDLASLYDVLEAILEDYPK